MFVQNMASLAVAMVVAMEISRELHIFKLNIEMILIWHINILSTFNLKTCAYSAFASPPEEGATRRV